MRQDGVDGRTRRLRTFRRKSRADGIMLWVTLIALTIVWTMRMMMEGMSSGMIMIGGMMIGERRKRENGYHERGNWTLTDIMLFLPMKDINSVSSGPYVSDPPHVLSASFPN